MIRAAAVRLESFGHVHTAIDAEREELMGLRRCANCQADNSPTNDLCVRCGRALSVSSVRTIASLREHQKLEPRRRGIGWVFRHGFSQGERVAIGMFPAIWILVTASLNLPTSVNVLAFLIAYGLFLLCGILIVRRRPQQI